MHLRCTPRGESWHFFNTSALNVGRLDRWEWAAVLIRTISGAFLMFLTLFDLKSGRPAAQLVLDIDTYGIINNSASPSVIWKFSDSGWM